MILSKNDSSKLTKELKDLKLRKRHQKWVRERKRDNEGGEKEKS